MTTDFQRQLDRAQLLIPKPDRAAHALWEPTVWERVKALFAAPLVGGMDQNTLAMGADFSHWSGDVPLSFFAMLDFISTKAVDGHQMYAGGSADKTNYQDMTFHPNVQKAYDAGKPMIPYIYLQWMSDQAPSYCAQWHYSLFKWATRSLVPGASFHAVAIDVEERGETSTNAKDKVEGLYNLLSSDPALRGMPIIIYTSMNVLSWYPALSDWLSYPGANRNLWLAQWLYYGGTATTWEEIRTKYIPQMNMKVMTPGSADWRFLQFAGDWAKIGGQSAMDLNFFKGSVEALWHWLGFSQIPSASPSPSASFSTSPSISPSGSISPSPSGEVPPPEYATRADLAAVRAEVEEIKRRLDAAAVYLKL